MKLLIADCLLLAGVGCLVTGLWQAWEPLGLIGLGIGVAGLAVAIASSRPSRTPTPTARRRKRHDR